MMKTIRMNRPIRSFFMAASSRSIRKRIRLVKRALPLTEAHAKIRPSMLAERCESGRIDMLGKHASRQRDRGFESHPLRQTALRVSRPLVIAVSSLMRADRHLKWDVGLMRLFDPEPQ